jgi:DNA repair photolyase
VDEPLHIKGRGSVRNPAGRFETQRCERSDDGWGGEGWCREEWPRRPVTSVLPEATRTIITRNQSPDVPFERSINPYRGCEHGCVYCFARPTHAYLGLSPGLDFETQIFFKPHAAELLRAEFARKRYQPEPIALAPNTDAYQPTERRLRITREVLEVLVEHRHPVAILTKSDLILRDLDLLTELARDDLVHVHLSVTTLDAELARRLEPRAATPRRRVAAIEELSAAGVATGVLASPIIPGLNDHELERILEASAAAGAESAGTALLRLPHQLTELFEQWLRVNYPLRAKRVMKLIRDCRDGELNDPNFGSRMRGSGAYADMIYARVESTMARLGLRRQTPPLDRSKFRVPEKPQRQLQLFADYNSSLAEVKI